MPKTLKAIPLLALSIIALQAVSLVFCPDIQQAKASEHDGWVEGSAETMPALRQTRLEPLLERPRFASEPEFSRYLQDARKQEHDGNKVLAKELYEKALDESGFTTWSSPRVVKVISHLELLSQSLGQQKEVERYQKKLSAIAAQDGLQITLDGPLTPEEIECRLLLADTLAYDNRTNEAARLYLTGFCTPNDTAHTSLYLRAMTAERLVRLHTRCGDTARAVEDIEAPFKAIDAIYQSNPSEVNARALLCVMTGKACLANYQGNLSEAAELNRRAFELLKKTPSASSIRQLWIYANKAKTLELQKDYPGAIAAYKKALSVANSSHPLSSIYLNPVQHDLDECIKQSPQ